MSEEQMRRFSDLLTQIVTLLEEATGLPKSALPLSKLTFDFRTGDFSLSRG